MDPCTAALLFRLDTESLQRLRCPEPGQCSVRDDILKGRLWKAIEREIHLHVPEADRPPSLAQMLLDMQMVARVELPSVVAAYAMRQKVVSHSLRASAYQRLEAHGHLSYRLAQDSAPVSEPVRSLASDNGREEKYAQPPWMRSLRLAMEGRNQKKILAALNVLKFAPNIQHNWGKYIVGFAIKLFEGESVARKRSLAKSTIRTHVRIVCRKFIGLLPIESIETVNLEELVAAYGQALDNAIDVGQSRGVRLNLVRSLREFHTYLHTEHGIPAVSESEVFGTENGLPAVNANIVSYEEYLKIRRRLSTPDGTRREWLCRIEDLIFTLAFSCGLRRMEIFGLRLDDLRWFAREDGAKFDRQVELLIRPSTLRNLKTKNSTRRIPPDAFLPGQDLRAILDWKQQRTNRHRASRNDLLFHHPELATLKEPERTIIEHIHDAMREITGDPSLHLHHLRHSFATWTFFRLMMSDIANIPRILGLQTTTSQWLKKSKKLRLRLYGNEFPTRRHAYAVAKLLGHSSPDISLEHYIHCMDWLLATSLANSVILAPGKLTLDAASGKASRTARRWRSAKKNSDTIQNQN